MRLPISDLRQLRPYLTPFSRNNT